ncbi:MAG: hypothetical protein ACI8TQ_002090 [Planctomycetota bacterium]|jgi:hypothetical protein
MHEWYRDHAVYTSPGRSGKPHPRKVRGTSRLINAVQHALGRAPASVFQIGSSDGYALSRFRTAGTEAVKGLDPSPASVALARETYDIEASVGTIEQMTQVPNCEVWLLTHVLEHLHNPLTILERAHAAGEQRPEWLVIEVPLFERPDHWPPGYLSFEHLNYFTEDSLVRMLNQAGFDVVSLDKQFADDIYPVVAVVARRCEPRTPVPTPGERERARNCLETYLEREQKTWSQIDARLLEQVGTPARLFLWGGGVFASQLLANTQFEGFAQLTGIFDSSEQNWGSNLGAHEVLAPKNVQLTTDDCIVISSFASELEIWDALAAERERGVRVIRLHT